MMHASANCLELIKYFEGVKLTAYLCPAQVWTIGVGHTGPDVIAGQTITMPEAMALLSRDLVRFEDGVNALVKVPLKQHQFDALVSFAFNLGAGALRTSTLLKLVNKGLHAEVPTQFMRWDKAGGRRLLGLARRRKAEAMLYQGWELSQAIAAANELKTL